MCLSRAQERLEMQMKMKRSDPFFQKTERLKDDAFSLPLKRFKYLRFYQRCLRCSWMICKNAVKQYAFSNKNA